MNWISTKDKTPVELEWVLLEQDPKHFTEEYPSRFEIGYLLNGTWRIKRDKFKYALRYFPKWMKIPK